MCNGETNLCPHCGRPLIVTTDPAQARKLSVGATLYAMAGVTVDEAIIESWSVPEHQTALLWLRSALLTADDALLPMPEFLKQYRECPLLDAT